MKSGVNMNRIVYLLVGGPKELIPTQFYTEIKKENNVVEKKILVGADYGAVLLAEQGVTLDLAVGDFDTATEAQLDLVLANSKQAVVDPAKDDKTDLEMALEYIIDNFEFDKIRIYGATGARMDQFLANLFFALKPKFSEIISKIEIIDRYNIITFYHPGQHQLEADARFCYLAFVPLGLVAGLTLLDTKYPLAPTDFALPISLSSNEFIKHDAHFKFDKGIVAVIQSKD